MSEPFEQFKDWRVKSQEIAAEELDAREKITKKQQGLDKTFAYFVETTKLMTDSDDPTIKVYIQDKSVDGQIIIQYMKGGVHIKDVIIYDQDFLKAKFEAQKTTAPFRESLQQRQPACPRRSNA